MKFRIIFLFITSFVLAQQSSNYAISLNGIDAYLEVLDNRYLRLDQTNFTIELVFNINNYNQNYQSILVSKRSNNLSKGYYGTVTGIIASDPYKPFFQKGSGLAPHLFGNNIVQRNKKYHISFCYNFSNTILQIILDGQIDNMMNNFPSPEDDCYNNLIIGKDTESDNYFLDGEIDELRIWGVERNIDAIRKTMNRPLGAEYYSSADSGLIAYYRFDKLENLEAGGDNFYDDIRDLSINGFHADIQGGAVLGSVNNNWNCEITLESNNKQRSVFFGQAEDATNTLDDNFGEFPEPLAGSSVNDIRFIIPDNENTGSQVDIRPQSDATPEWQLVVQPANNNYPVQLKWDPYFLTSGQFVLTSNDDNESINVNMNSSFGVIIENASQSTLTITKNITTTSAINYNAGWNIVSVPVVANNMQASSIFSDASSNVFKFNNGYTVASALECGEAYWVKYSESGTKVLTGSVTFDSVAISQGWNLIAPYNYNVNKTQITSQPENILRNLIYAFNNGYSVVNVMTPGNGYWVYAEQDGKIFYNTVPLKTEDTERIVEDKYIVIVDASRKIMTLYFTNDNKKVSDYLLPPIPPDGIFDARFGNDKLFSNTKSEYEILNLRSARYPVTITSKGINLEINNGFNSVILSENKPLSITNKNVKSITINKIIVANKYSLFNNFPNPFNPETKIEYYLPEEANVKIDVFNSIGKLVTTLENGTKPQGLHKVTFKAGSLASGVYYYRLTAGKFVKVNKMLLLK